MSVPPSVSARPPSTVTEETRLWVRSLALWRVWGHLGWRDVRVRYALTALGPTWTTINVLITSVFLGIVYSTVFGIDLREYLPYVASGIMIWNFVSVTLVEATNHLNFYRSLLLNTSQPLPVFTASLVWRNTVIFLMSAPVVMLIVAIAMVGVPATWLLVPLALALAVAALLPLSHLLGLLGLRFPDFVVLMPSLLFLVFLTTPILWSPQSVGERTWIYRYNPVYWLVDLLRAPLLGQTPPATAWIVVAVMAALAWLATIAIGRRVGSKARLLL